jgi:hypothetical protein
MSGPPNGPGGRILRTALNGVFAKPPHARDDKRTVKGRGFKGSGVVPTTPAPDASAGGGDGRGAGAGADSTSPGRPPSASSASFRVTEDNNLVVGSRAALSETASTPARAPGGLLRLPLPSAAAHGGSLDGVATGAGSGRRPGTGIGPAKRAPVGSAAPHGGFKGPAARAGDDDRKRAPWSATVTRPEDDPEYDRSLPVPVAAASSAGPAPTPSRDDAHVGAVPPTPPLRGTPGRATEGRGGAGSARSSGGAAADALPPRAAPEAPWGPLPPAGPKVCGAPGA